MKRFTASILALSLAAGVGTASAQSASGYSTYGQPTTTYGQPTYGQPSYGQPSYGQPSYGQSSAYHSGPTSGAYYDYARVVRVDPVIESGYGGSAYAGQGVATSDGRRCYRDQGSYTADGYRSDSYGNDGYGNTGYGNTGYGGYANPPSTVGSNVATVVGGLLGAAVGSQLGGGSARYATAALGTMVGGMAGRQVYNHAHQPVRTATVEVCDPVQTSNGYRNDAGGYTSSNDGRVTGYDVTYEYAGRTYTTRTSYNPGDRMRVRVDVNPG
ncbi:MAG: glycine zipper 2TM domain-containing protein [Luteimonas sp.]